MNWSISFRGPDSLLQCKHQWGLDSSAEEALALVRFTSLSCVLAQYFLACWDSDATLSLPSFELSVFPIPNFLLTGIGAGCGFGIGWGFGGKYDEHSRSMVPNGRASPSTAPSICHLGFVVSAYRCCSLVAGAPLPVLGMGVGEYTAALSIPSFMSTWSPKNSIVSPPVGLSCY